MHGPCTVHTRARAPSGTTALNEATLLDKLAGLKKAKETHESKDYFGNIKNLIGNAERELEANRAEKSVALKRLVALRNESSELVAVPVRIGQEEYDAVLERYVSSPGEKQALDDINEALEAYPCKASHGSKAKAGVKQPEGSTAEQLQVAGKTNNTEALKLRRVVGARARACVCVCGGGGAMSSTSWTTRCKRAHTLSCGCVCVFTRTLLESEITAE